MNFGVAESVVFTATSSLAGNTEFAGVSITVVPEPDTIAMMVAGLVAVGASLRLRRQR
jgi:hypothetical protein